MFEQIFVVFIQSFVGSLLGGYGGYLYAIRDTPRSKRPIGLWQLSRSLIAGVGGAFLSVLFEIAVVMAVPNADTKNLIGMSLVFGVGLGVMLTQRYLKGLR